MFRRLLLVTAAAVLLLVAATAPAPADARPAPLRLAFLGDSLTMGLHASADDNTYRMVLAERILRPNGGSIVATVIQDPFGLADDAVARVGPVLDVQPDVIILEVGNHEAFAAAEEVDRFPARYEELLDYLQGTGATLIAGTLAWLNYPVESREYAHALRVNQMIRDLCARRGVPVADLWTPTVFRYDLISQPGDVSAVEPFDGDRLHPNDGGHRALADAFWSAYQREVSRLALVTIGDGGPPR
ncbi:MAG: SGNH/GDSL hydrolase family protein [Dehalococcoidia bacterium]